MTSSMTPFIESKAWYEIERELVAIIFTHFHHTVDSICWCLVHGELKLSLKLRCMQWVWVIEGAQTRILGEYYTPKVSLTKFCPK